MVRKKRSCFVLIINMVLAVFAFSFLVGLQTPVASAEWNNDNENNMGWHPSEDIKVSVGGGGQTATTVPLYRLYLDKDGNKDHFYTTSEAEKASTLSQEGWVDEGMVGYIFATPQIGTVPLYRVFSLEASDHLYTTDEVERDNAINNLGYDDETVAGGLKYLLVGYIYPPAESIARIFEVSGGTTAETIPLYRLFSSEASDHFFTTDPSDRDNAISLGYVDEGVAGYIFATEQTITIGLSEFSLQAYADANFMLNTGTLENWTEANHADTGWHNAGDIKVRVGSGESAINTSLQSYIDKIVITGNLENTAALAVWNDEGHSSWHSGEEIKIRIGGKYYSVQEAISTFRMMEGNPDITRYYDDMGQYLADYLQDGWEYLLVPNRDLKTNSQAYFAITCDDPKYVVVGVTYKKISHPTNIGTDRADAVSVICAPIEIDETNRKISIIDDQKVSIQNPDMLTRIPLYGTDYFAESNSVVLPILDIVGIGILASGLSVVPVTSAATGILVTVSGGAEGILTLALNPIVVIGFILIYAYLAIGGAIGQELIDHPENNNPEISLTCGAGEVVGGITYEDYWEHGCMPLEGGPLRCWIGVLCYNDCSTTCTGCTEEDVDGLKAYCVKMTSKGNIDYRSKSEIKTSDVGKGTNNQYGPFMCPEGKVMVGIAWKDRMVDGKAYDMLDGATPLCVEYYPFR